MQLDSPFIIRYIKVESLYEQYFGYDLNCVFSLWTFNLDNQDLNSFSNNTDELDWL